MAHFLAIFLRLDFWDSKVKAQVCVSGDLFFLLFDSAVWPRVEHTHSIIIIIKNLAIFFAAAVAVIDVAEVAKKKKQSISSRESAVL